MDYYFIFHLQNIWLICFYNWEYLQSQFKLRFINLLIKIGNNVRLSHVEKKVISENKWPYKFDKGSITNSQVFNFERLRF